MKTKRLHWHKRNYILTIIAVIPIALLGIALFFIVSLNYNNTLKTAEDYTSLILNHLYLESEAKFQTLIETIDLIDGNIALRRALEDENYTFEPALTRELYNIKNSYSFINNVYIFNKDSDLVYTADSTCSAYTFFEHINIYQDYSVAYWRRIPFLYDENYRILLPTVMESSDASETVIPVVLRKISGLEQKNLLIININLSALMKGQSTGNLTKNTALYIMNKVTGDVFNQEGKLLEHGTFPEEFIGNLYQFGSNVFQYNLENGKVIVPAYTASRSLSGYTYFATIPTDDIKSQIIPYVLFSFVVIILFLAFAFVLTIRNTTKIISPLKDIVGAFTKNNDTQISGDILKDAKNLALSSQKISTKLTRLIPYAQEKYLMSILNSTEYSIDNLAKETLLDVASFPHNYFAVIIIQVMPTNKLFRLYNSEEYYCIQSGFYGIIKDIFSDNFTNFILPTENSKLHIVLNLEENSEIKKADYLLNNICSYFKNDMEYINILIGKSEIHNGIEGVKQCYLEAAGSFSPRGFIPNYVMLDEPKKKFVNFTSKDENILFSALLSYDSDKTYSVLKSIFQKNENISEYSTKKLYNQILNIILKIMQIKNIPHKSGQLDFEIVNCCLSKPLEIAFNDMMELIDYVLTSGKNLAQNKLNHVEIVAYIEEHFCDAQLNLGVLADFFKISQSSATTAVKNITGTGFHEYLSHLRMQKAIQLLTNTNQNIQNICLACGFNNTKTFYRIFKNATGLTPNEYRKIH